MRFRALTTLVRKELTDILRDRRTLVATLVIPIVLYPLLFVLMGGIISSNQARVAEERPRVALWGPVPPEVTESLHDALDPSFEREAMPADPQATARLALTAEEVHLVVAVEAAPADLASGEDTVEIDLYFSVVDPLGRSTIDRAREALDGVSERALQGRAEARGIEPSVFRPLEIDERDVATPQERGGDVAGRLIPLLVLIMVTTGATFAAIDVTAGEKERGTMQTLLVAPVRSVELIGAKYVAVLVVALAAAALNLAGMGFALGRQAASIGDATDVEVGFSIAPIAFLQVFALLVPTAMLIAAVLLVVTVFARSFREAQSYTNPVFILVIVAGLAALSDIETSATTALIPLVNVVMVTRDVLRGGLTQSFLVTAFAANLAFATGAVLFAARVFESEQVLLGGERPWRDVVARRSLRSTPTGRGAAGFAVALLVLVFYGSLLASRLGFVSSLVFLEVGLLLVPALAFVWLGGYSPRQTLWLRAPPRGTWAGSALVATGAWSAGNLAALGLSAALPSASSCFEQLGERVGLQSADIGLIGALVVFAVLPALGEEVCFRGVILSGLRSSGSAAGAVVGSAVLFGLFHISPFHMVPAAVIGVVLAVGVLATRSIAVGLAGHAVANGLATLIALDVVPAAFDHPGTLVAGLAATVAGLALLWRSRARDPADRDPPCVSVKNPPLAPS